MEPIKSWQAKEFEKKEKSKAWFIGLGVVFLALTIFALWQGSYTTIILFILMGIVVYIYSLKEPQSLNYSITPQGVKIEDKLYEFDEIDSFWVFYDPPEVKYISLKTESHLGQNVHIPLGDEDPNEIRDLLDRFLPEEKQEESLADVIARNLRFWGADRRRLRKNLSLFILEADERG